MEEPPKNFSIKKFLKSFLREIIVPIVLALVVIQYVIQAFQIPGSKIGHLRQKSRYGRLFCVGKLFSKLLQKHQFKAQSPFHSLCHRAFQPSGDSLLCTHEISAHFIF